MIDRLTGAVLVAPLLALLASCGGGGGGGGGDEPPMFSTREALGESLFFDTSLSLNRTQACATCHNPDHGFIDSRPDDTGRIGAVSLGDDGFSLGDRNAPTASYAAFIPTFGEGTQERFNSDQPDYEGFLGGLFLDGREPDLAGQASGPPVNPIEMGMPDRASVVARIQENSDYVESFEELYGSDVFDDVDTAYTAMTVSIAAYERTELFAPFDSKYDRSLRGEYVYDPLSKAALGRSLFFSAEFTNCATCHQLRPNGNRQETFTSYEYHNIGVPSNDEVRMINGTPPDVVDEGLLSNPAVSDPAERGKFKVPTLRNVAVTEPYMHNGVFRDLRTAVEFYDKFLVGSENLINPETGEPWRDPEVPETVSLTELEDGRNLIDDEIEAMVCFLRTLTDQRYEHLIEDKGIDCGE